MSDLQQHPGGMSRRSTWTLIGFLVVGAYFLLTEHRAHLFGILPYLLVLACPLMHLFHRHGHGGHHESASPDEAYRAPVSPDDAAPPAPPRKS